MGVAQQRRAARAVRRRGGRGPRRRAPRAVRPCGRDPLAPAVGVRLLRAHVVVEEAARGLRDVGAAEAEERAQGDRSRRSAAARRGSPRAAGPRRSRRRRARSPRSARATTRSRRRRVRGRIRPWVCATREAEASRPSRTTWMKRASGKTRTRVCACRDVVGALLDDPAGRPRARRPGTQSRSKKSRRQATSRSASNVGLEAGGGGVEAVALDEPVHAAEAVALKALPPEPAQALHELLEGDLAREQAREAVGVGVEAELDRDQRHALVAREQPGEDVGAAAAGAADEGDRGDVVAARDLDPAKDGFRLSAGGPASLASASPAADLR